jgi:hypothetical protein
LQDKITGQVDTDNIDEKWPQKNAKSTKEGKKFRRDTELCDRDGRAPQQPIIVPVNSPEIIIFLSGRQVAGHNGLVARSPKTKKENCSNHG